MTLVQSERSVTFCAEVQDPSGARNVPLPRGSLRVGSAPHCAIVVADATVSAEHLMLVVEDEHVLVRDAQSKNGTYVGAVRVREASAPVGAIITLGRSTITLRASPGLDVDIDVEPLPGLAGSSIAMRRIAAQVHKLAPLRFPVLVCGESGTGKELVAHALHTLSPRKHKPFIAINVTSVPRELVESEFFGHERGSFTGAVSRRRGAFEDAEGGTLFLDEIGDLPADTQPKLLRALDGYGIRSVGGTGSATRRDARVVAATHAPLRERVDAGDFRRDLFHRLEVFTIVLPPLRERRGDIGPISRALLRAMEPDIGLKELTTAALARLVCERWPGNVRELRNALVRAAAVSPSETIDEFDVDAAIGRRVVAYDAQPVHALTPELAQTMVREHRGNVSAAARAAGFPRTSFRKLLGLAK
jgi:DNA-binding NtrC family response regulator